MCTSNTTNSKHHHTQPHVCFGAWSLRTRRVMHLRSTLPSSCSLCLKASLMDLFAFSMVNNTRHHCQKSLCYPHAQPAPRKTLAPEVHAHNTWHIFDEHHIGLHHHCRPSLATIKPCLFGAITGLEPTSSIHMMYMLKLEGDCWNYILLYYYD